MSRLESDLILTNKSLYQALNIILEESDIEIIKNSLSLRTIISYDDVDGSIYQSYYKLFPNFSFLKRYLVVILSK